MRNMKKNLLFIFAALFTFSAQAQNTLKLMSYNIKNANGMDNVCNFQRIANVINNASPDVVAIQEVDSMTNRSGQKYVLGEIADRTQMHGYFAPAIDYDGGKYGIGLLTKQVPLRLQTLPLPGREEARTLILAEFADYIYCCTHMSLTEEDRMKSLELVKAFTSSSTKPLFLAGDMNAEPESGFIKELQKDFQILSNPKQHTFPAPDPKETIDYIATLKQNAKGFAVISAKVINEPMASDHRPILVELRTAEKADKIFRMKPYLQNPVGNGITVMWETTVPAYCWVEYGTDTTQLKRARTIVDGQVVCNNYLHKIRIDGLQPGQKYYYRVCSQEILLYQAYKKVFGNTAQSAFSEFTLPATDTDSFTAVVFNDLHQHTQTFRSLCQQIKNVNYDFVVFNGDCVDDPVDHNQATSFISELTEGVCGDRIPTFFMRGNHEIRNAYSIGLRDHYDYVGDRTYGSFNWGDTRIVMLDCGEDKPDDHWVYYGLNDFTQLRNEQVDFLKKELSSKEFKKAGKRVLIHHIPLYGNDGKNLCANLWTKLLEKAPFNISLNAHTHKYAYHPKGELGNNYPVIIGGGYKMDGATVMILEKKKDELRVKVLNAKGKILLDITV
ncbi:endonuclease/exonuclease/phosphatase family protein [Bacteroides caccae]|uniref:Endonuclease n=1 Tax=Bacteroides caccae TaxID=47678 RepID=A0A6H9QE96_9BACE|nr:endonuclease/exonuclease/phosphatase family protein [Bacteroides caccae]KAA5468223.1 endonuclease [Bacteroides caccae]KAA5477671.1 endonuclease [Bacteroides caccae]KAA5487929.1 endonuclease [Bacteroides caccae]MEE0759441.1 metallophosphoesterase [Bacteroides caccae]RYU04751.1 endonuclease [Bacteroides caccae]